jgi:hypothetical protein
MNYLAHALPFLDRPYFVAGTAVPDWLTVVDRRVRVRSKHAEPFLGDADSCLAAVAGGVLQHLRDDLRFHSTRAFAETSLELTVRVRDSLGGETGLRPAFLGHLLTELLLDAALAAEDPGRVTAYYRALDEVDAARVEEAVNRMAPRPIGNCPDFRVSGNGTVPLNAGRLAMFIGLFRRERILWDYLEDAKLMVRLNQIMRRVRQEPLHDDFVAILPAARELVTRRKSMLLDGIPQL